MGFCGTLLSDLKPHRRVRRKQDCFQIIYNMLKQTVLIMLYLVWGLYVARNQSDIILN